ncbi:MAG: sigma-70 family RNA polymerase sigma factor [Bacteroidales bacterium]|nr:sigma-70 family RNA polymerase sigma factor [Bacteroidales bacterium]
MNCERFLNTFLPLQPAMQLVAERLLHSADDAEDMVQEAFVELWENREKLRHIVNLEGYAMQTVKNRCLTLLRKQKDYTSDDIDRLGDISDEEATAEAALNEERSVLLDHMMQRLPEVQRRAVQMRYIDQLSHEEMQRQLGMSSANVYTTLSRAVSALKAMSHE